MRSITVNIELPEDVRPEIEWAWDLFCRHFGIPYRIERANIGDLFIGKETEDRVDVPIAERTEQILREKSFEHRTVFPGEPLIRCKDGRKDVLGTAFYMVNSLQEHAAKSADLDELGRFKYDASYQYRFGIIEEDLVSQLFEELHEELPIAGREHPSDEKASELFLTHDIDQIERGNLREAYWKLKNGKWSGTLSSLIEWVKGDHEWNNIEAILDLHEERGMKSNFFWLTERGRDRNGTLNADYDILAPEYKRLQRAVKVRGSSNGLHKSTFDKSLNEEFEKLENAIAINRNHFLKIALPEHYEKLEDAGFLLDSSLGFSNAIGFRNNYGRPFHPFDQRTRTRMDLLEVPLQIMDITLFRNYEDPMRVAERFIEKNQEKKVLTLLWHNSYLTNGRFKDWKQIYSSILDEAQKRGMEHITPRKLLMSDPSTRSLE